MHTYSYVVWVWLVSGGFKIFQVLALSCQQWQGFGHAVTASLDVAVVISTIGFGHVHFAHGVTDVVNAVFTGRHALVDAV